jgi:hypothetical protein
MHVRSGSKSPLTMHSKSSLGGRAVNEYLGHGSIKRMLDLMHLAGAACIVCLYPCYELVPVTDVRPPSLLTPGDV